MRASHTIFRFPSSGDFRDWIVRSVSGFLGFISVAHSVRARAAGTTSGQQYAAAWLRSTKSQCASMQQRSANQIDVSVTLARLDALGCNSLQSPWRLNAEH